MIDPGDPLAINGVTAIREPRTEVFSLLRLADEIEIDDGREDDKSCDRENQPEDTPTGFHKLHGWKSIVCQMVELALLHLMGCNANYLADSSVAHLV